MCVVWLGFLLVFFGFLSVLKDIFFCFFFFFCRDFGIVFYGIRDFGTVTVLIFLVL